MLEALHASLLPILRYALAQVPLPRAGLALDLACGAGEKTPLLADVLEPGVRLLGIDIDRAVLRAVLTNDQRRTTNDQQLAAGDQLPAIDAGSAGERSSFVVRRSSFVGIVADAHALPLREACLDAAFCIAALGLFADPQAALDELRRALRPAAPALLVTAERMWAPLIRWPEELAARLCERLQAIHGGHGEHGFDEGTSLRVPRCPPWINNPDLGDNLVALLAAAGFAAAHVRAFLLEDAPHPLRLELPLLPWPALRPLAAGALAPSDLERCDVIAAQADIELSSVALVALALH
jgi:SAM-dependent methyltransferase